MDYSLTNISLVFIAFLLMGFSKTTVGGVGLLAIGLLTMVFSGKVSSGIFLPILFFADILAVAYYRHSINFSAIFKLLPLTLMGVVIGYNIMGLISNEFFNTLLGLLILSMIVLSLLDESGAIKIHKGKFLTIVIGLLAGISTMMANAAGPLLGLYLLSMGLSKKEFMGTRSWFFLLVNLFKIPFSAKLGLITYESLKIDLMFLPAVVLGAGIGIVTIKHINLGVFKWWIRVAAAVAAIRLLW